MQGLLEEVIDFQRRKKLDNTLRNASISRMRFQRLWTLAVSKGKRRQNEQRKYRQRVGTTCFLSVQPGEGKSLLASAIPESSRTLSDAEKVQLTKIYSACGELKTMGTHNTRRPMRSVHHTASKQSSYWWGSKIPRPGEVTLAHLGVLFLDEIAEFSRATLESLRQPIEAGEVHITRVQAVTLPTPVSLHWSPQ